jgi:hypothetical protein
MDTVMDKNLSNADIIAMFESVGVRPIDRDKDHLRDLMGHCAPQRDGDVMYKTVLSNGTGNPVQGGTDAKLERNSQRAPSER